MVGRSIPADSHRPSHNLDQGRRSGLGHQVPAGNRSLAPTQRLHTGDAKHERDSQTARATVHKLERWWCRSATRNYSEVRPFSGQLHTARARKSTNANLPYSITRLRKPWKREDARYSLG